METPSDIGNYPFLAGGGEMGELTRNYDWSTSAVGTPDQWPTSLRTLVNMMLTSRFPMLIFWGPKLITFYNDAFRPSLGDNGKHPSSLGQRGEESWAESWPVIGPMIYNIMAGGDAVWFEDQKLPLYRDGQIGYAYWTYSFSPVTDDAGVVNGILVTCSETTKAVESLQQLSEANAGLKQSLMQNTALQQVQTERDAQFRNVANSSPTGLWLSDEEGGLTYLNETLVDWTGMAYEDLLGTGWANAIIEADRSRAATAFASAVAARGHYDALFRINKPDGSIIWCRAAGDPFYHEDGSYAGYAGFCMDIQAQIETQQQITESEQRFQNLIREATVGIIVLIGEELQVSIVNDAYGKLINRTHNELIGRKLFDVIPETEAYFRPIADGVRNNGEPLYLYSVPYSVQTKGTTKAGYLDLVYQPYREADGTITGVMVLCQDVTEQVLARKDLEESEERFRAMAEGTDIFIAVSDETNDTTYFNKAWVELTGKSTQQLLNFGWVALVHPDDVEHYINSYHKAFTNHEPFDGEFRVLNKEGNYRWLLAQNTPRFHTDGSLAGYISACVDTTERKLQQQELLDSETKLRGIISAAPAGIGLFVGRDLIIENPNQTFIDIVGKGPGIVGLPLREAMPELISEGQPFLKILDDVFTTGKQFQSPGSLVKIVQNGVMTNNYYNITYTPVFDAEGKVYAILDIAIDVSEEVKARKKLQETEDVLRGAIELAEMGTWELDVSSGTITYSERLRKLFEFSQDTIDMDSVYNPIHEEDRLRLQEAMNQASRPELGGTLNEEYTVVTQRTGRQRIVRVSAKMYFDANEQPYKMVGTMQDITEQRQIQLALEQQVQQRTEQLGAVNEELAANNEELATTNEQYAVVNAELEEANDLLKRSNDNLQTFAYVASHDLQEPLRKIQQFGDLLKTRYAESTGEELVYLERMQSAASRMSTLIRDLLNFSRMSTQRDSNTSVSLNEVVDNVLTTLEFTISETKAKVDVDSLPTVLGDASQLGQLFQNLVGNALKFRRVDVISWIQVRSCTIEATQLPTSVKPTRSARTYYRIDVADNGIGFDEKYLDRIFQVFQRLHSKREFEGTGIGLAICEKVVTNHGGAITAESQPGQGTTFSIYLPA